MSGADVTLITNGGAVAVLLVVFLLIVRGFLVPKRTVDSLLEGQKAAVEYWKHAAEQREKALVETIPLLKAAIENHETVVKMVTGMESAVKRLIAEDRYHTGDNKGGEQIAQALAKED